MPTGFVRRVDQPTAEMCGVISRAIEMGAVSSRFVMQEPASGVIPGHQTIIEQQVAMSGWRHAVLVGGASQRGSGCQSGEIRVHGGAQRLGQVGRADETFLSDTGTGSASRRLWLQPRVYPESAPRISSASALISAAAGVIRAFSMTPSPSAIACANATRLPIRVAAIGTAGKIGGNVFGEPRTRRRSVQDNK